VTAQFGTQAGVRQTELEPKLVIDSHRGERLLECLNRLVDAGHSLLVIEHHLDVIKTADHVIDLGPEGGHAGGEVVVTGTPEQVAACRSSHTGRYLRHRLRT
jgi:excinuclease ABC subunit A